MLRPCFPAWSLAAVLSTLGACGSEGTDEAPEPTVVATPRPSQTGEAGALDPALAAAIDAAADRLDADPASAARWRELGMLYHANAFAELAEICYGAGLARDPRDAAMWYARGLNLAQLGDVTGARGCVERSLEIDSSYAPGFWRLGEWVLADGDAARAEAWYQRCTQVDPNLANGWIGLARVYLQRGQAQEAAQVLAERVLRGPSGRYACQLLARAYNELGRSEDARLFAAQGRGANPELPDPRLAEVMRLRTGRSAELDRAASQVASGRVTEGIRTLEALLASYPRDAVVLANLADALLRANQAPRALVRAREAAAAAPEAWQPLLVQAQAVEALAGAKGSPEALSLVEQVLARRPTEFGALYFKGLLHERMGDPAAALAAFTQASAQSPDHLDALLYVARMQRELNLDTLAAETYGRIFELDPVHQRARFGLAAVRRKLGDLAGAEDLLRRAAETHLATPGASPADTRLILTELAEVLEARGKAAEAATLRARIPGG